MNNRQAAALQTERVSLFYGRHQVLREVSLQVPRGKITALIGPSGCGKSSLLRCFNRMNDLVPDCRTEGLVLVEGRDITRPQTDVTALRRQVGLVAQRAQPFAGSVRDNLIYGLKLRGAEQPAQLESTVERVLRQVGLWPQLSLRLDDDAASLSGGQLQRLMLARTLAVEPAILLLDEPASAQDPATVAGLEALLRQLTPELTVLMVTHNLQQARRLSDYTAFLSQGKLIESGRTQALFTRPRQAATATWLACGDQ